LARNGLHVATKIPSRTARHPAEKKARKKHVKNTTFSQQNPYNTPTKPLQNPYKNTTKLTARNVPWLREPPPVVVVVETKSSAD